MAIGQFCTVKAATGNMHLDNWLCVLTKTGKGPDLPHRLQLLPCRGISKASETRTERESKVERVRTISLTGGKEATAAGRDMEGMGTGRAKDSSSAKGIL